MLGEEGGRDREDHRFRMRYRGRTGWSRIVGTTAARKFGGDGDAVVGDEGVLEPREVSEGPSRDGGGGYVRRGCDTVHNAGRGAPLRHDWHRHRRGDRETDTRQSHAAHVVGISPVALGEGFHQMLDGEGSRQTPDGDNGVGGE